MNHTAFCIFNLLRKYSRSMVLPAITVLVLSQCSKKTFIKTEATPHLRHAIALNTNNFDSLILDSATIAVVEFCSSKDDFTRSYDWVIDSLAKIRSNQVRIGFVNTDLDTSFLQRFPLRTLPAYLFFKDADIAYLYRVTESQSHLFDTLDSHLQTLLLTHQYITMLNKRNFKNKINDSHQIAMVDFFIPSCSVCQKMDRVVAEVAKTYANRALIGKVDISKDDSLVYMYNAMEPPTFVFFDEGQQYKTVYGPCSQDSLIKILDERINSKSIWK